MDIKHYLAYWLTGFVQPAKIRTLTAKSIYDIDYQRLKNAGIKLLVFDVDDTIAEHKGTIPERTTVLFKHLSLIGFKLALFSNCSTARTRELDKLFAGLDIYNSQRSDKPNPVGYLEICEHYKVVPEQAAMIGEKMGTDIYGGYLAKYKERILVQPFTEVFSGKKANLAIRILRRMENLFA
jgi:HAD superfamily phosphatase (TIGR01668 family)